MAEANPSTVYNPNGALGLWPLKGRQVVEADHNSVAAELDEDSQLPCRFDKVLVEVGSSTIKNLKAGLVRHGLATKDQRMLQRGDFKRSG